VTEVPQLLTALQAAPPLRPLPVPEVFGPTPLQKMIILCPIPKKVVELNDV